MSVSDYGLFFSSIFLIYILFHTIHLVNYETIQYKQTEYNIAIDEAVEAALFDSVEMDSVKSVTVNEQVVIERFFDALYMNLGVMENPSKKKLLREYVPFILFVRQDGIVPYLQTESMSKHEVSFRSGEKYLYQWEGEQGDVLKITLSDFVVYEDSQKTKYLEGYYGDVVSQLPEYFKITKHEFGERKRQLVLEEIKKCTADCVNNQNRIAKKFGMVYSFELPLIEHEEWYRTIQDISLLVMFQGYPFGSTKAGVYNRVAIGGARVAKKMETA